MEIFGYDFILDENLNPWLIEVNTNPCLEESSKLLKMLISRMVDDALKLTVDVIFPPRKQRLLPKIEELPSKEQSFSLVIGSEPGIGCNNLKGPIRMHPKDEVPAAKKS